MLTRDTARRFESGTPESAPESLQQLDRPPWMAAEGLDRLPPPLREAVQRTVEPAHQHFVHDADDEMDESLGATMVHVMWLELLSQIDLARRHAEIASEPTLSDEFRDLIDRHMRLVAAKLRICGFLLRNRRAREADASQSGPMGGLLGMMAMHRAAMAQRQAACAETAGRSTDAETPNSAGPSQEGPAEEPAAAEQGAQTAGSTAPRQAEPSVSSTNAPPEPGPSGQTAPAGGPAHSNGQNAKNAEQLSAGRPRERLPKPIRRGNLFRRAPVG